MAHLSGLVFRIRSLQPAGDLLGRPIQSEPFRNGPPEPRIGRQFTTFRTTSAVPGLLIGRRRAVTIIAAIAADFSAHRRGRAAQQPGYQTLAQSLSATRPAASDPKALFSLMP